MASDVQNSLDDQSPLGLSTDVADQLGYRRKVAAGEDVVVDETVFLSVASDLAQGFLVLTPRFLSTPRICPRAW